MLREPSYIPYDDTTWPKHVIKFIQKRELSGDSTSNLWSLIEDCIVCVRVPVK
jgi:hypothetical protein